jgi:hypothetical protein
VLATGTTEFPEPYSYVMVFVDHVDKVDTTEVEVNGEALGDTQLVHCDDRLSVSVSSGRLVVFVFELNKMS